MKSFIIVLIGFFILAGCQNEENVPTSASSQDPQVLDKTDKVDICHLDDDGNFIKINVSVKALDAHLAHGDFLADPDGDECGPMEEETIFALAYTDVNPSDGDFNEAVDVLIAKWVDGPAGSPDGVVGPGDVIVTNQYPLGRDEEGLDFTLSSSFGTFTVQSHTLVTVTTNQAFGILDGFDADGSLFRFQLNPDTERYQEISGLNQQWQILFADAVTSNGNSPDIRGANPLGPSQPDQAIQGAGFPEPAPGTDDAFVDVVIDPDVFLP